MQALVFTDLGRVELQEWPEPFAAPGEVVVEVRACGVCGSDLHGIHAPSIRVPPLIMGHEMAGTTTDGRRVVVNPVLTCGTCDRCAADQSEICRHRAIVGIHRHGGYAEKVAVPEAALHLLPEDVGFEQAAMIEPFANAVHAWRRGAEPDVRRVGVLGAGTVGLVCLLVARAMADVEVVVADLAPERLEVATSLGAASVATALDGEFDLIFDGVGASATRHASVEHLRPGGTAVWLGLMDSASPVDGLDVIRSEKRVLGSFCYSDGDFTDAVQLCRRLPTDWVTSFPLSQSDKVFTELMHGRTDIAKAVFVP